MSSMPVSCELDHKSSIPLYLQVYRILCQWLEENPPQDGKLPREVDLCHAFGVSHHTIQQAIQMLVDERQLVRIKRRGTFLTRSLSCFDYQHPVRRIGLVLPEGATWKHFAVQIQKDVSNVHFSMLVSSYRWGDMESERRALKRALGNCSGTIFYPHHLAADDALKEFLPDCSACPMVLFDFYPQEYLYDFVSTDHLLGSRLMIEQLARKQYQRILLLDDGTADLSIRLRSIGCELGITQCRLPSPRLGSMGDIACGKDLRNLLEESQCEVIFLLANPPLRFQRLLKRAYASSDYCMSLPPIVSWDDLRSMELPCYIGFLYQQRYELGHAAFSLLFDKLKHPMTAKQRILLMPGIHFNEA